MRKYFLHVLIISFVFIAIPITSATGGSITLRSHYRSLSLSQVQSMANVSMRKIDEHGFFGHSTINHDYNLKAIKGDMVVVEKEKIIRELVDEITVKKDELKFQLFYLPEIMNEVKDSATMSMWLSW